MTDTEMKVRGLCETLASANASAAACCRELALVEILAGETREEFLLQAYAYAGNATFLPCGILPSAPRPLAVIGPEWDGLGEVV